MKKVLIIISIVLVLVVGSYLAYNYFETKKKEAEIKKKLGGLTLVEFKKWLLSEFKDEFTKGTVNYIMNDPEARAWKEQIINDNNLNGATDEQIKAQIIKDMGYIYTNSNNGEGARISNTGWARDWWAFLTISKKVGKTFEQVKNDVYFQNLINTL